MIGTVLDGTYQVIAKLGEGGMGVVYEAEHVKTHRRVAIKVILGEFKPDATLIARFQREARAAGAIDSPHIAQVLDAGTDPESGAPYLVMELLKGRDVDVLMKRMIVLRPTLALRIVGQALAGLERAHNAKVVHRDIKPANLYVAEGAAGQGSERIVKIVDFGVAKVKDDVTASRAEHSLTQTSSLLGSPLYMSPEQARTSKTVDGRADIWSLGTVLFQLLAGEAPHHQATSLTELLLAVCTEPAAPIQERAPWVPPEIATIVARSLEIDIARRYQTAGAMLADIEAIVPDWAHLDESMITPLTDEERMFVAEIVEPPPSLHISTGPSLNKTVANSLRPESLTGVQGISAPGAREVRETRKRRTLPFVLLGAAVVGIFGTTFALTRSERPKPVPAGIVEPPKPVEAPPPPPPPSVESVPSVTPPPTTISKPIPKPNTTSAAAPAPKPAPPPKPTPTTTSSISRDFN